MVEFRFDIRPLFSQPIIKVTSNLLPHTFRGDRRDCLDATSKMSEIIDRLGQLSATAQKLNTPVTTAQRLRMSENQTIYLMADVQGGHHGSVIGLLKVGKKDLYLFDETGQTRKVDKAPSILDFYIHESRQRAGMGKTLFETMLKDEQWAPLKCSVDRPSEKLLGFLKKHYGLERTIPQANNFVLYEGFFDDAKTQAQRSPQTNGGGMYITNSPNTQLFGATYLGDGNDRRRTTRGQLDANNAPPAPITQISPVGRYGARRPTCSMAEIIHSVAAPTQGAEPGSDHKVEYVTESLETLQIEDNGTAAMTPQPQEEMHSQAAQQSEEDAEAQGELAEEAEAEANASQLDDETDAMPQSAGSQPRSKTPSVSESTLNHEFGGKPPTFHLSKQHTGLKNRSYGVGLAVTPSSKMEFDQEAREDFGIVKINRPIGAGAISPSASHPADDNMSTVSSSGEGMTDQGYYDLKFYHNKLW